MAGTYRSGRHPKPTALKALQGSRVRPGRELEPVYERGVPDCPEFVRADPLALAAWETTARRIDASGVLTQAHGPMLAVLAKNMADYERACVQMATMGFQLLVIEESRNERGVLLRRRLKENPLLRRLEKLSLLVIKALGEFGLTPITSTRVDAHGPGASAPTDAFEVFIGGRPA